MIPSITPDLDGFRDATVRMRAKLGKDIPFFTPVAGAYPPGTALDPESGEPFDPTIQQAGSGMTSQSVHCGVYPQPAPADFEDSVKESALGAVDEADAVLDVAPGDFDTKNLDLATTVVISGETYEITDTDRDGIAGVVHRVLVFCRKE